MDINKIIGLGEKSANDAAKKAASTLASDTQNKNWQQEYAEQIAIILNDYISKTYVGSTNPDL